LDWRTYVVLNFETHTRNTGIAIFTDQWIVSDNIFAIGETGTLYIRGDFDYETQQNYTVTIMVSRLLLSTICFEGKQS